MLFELIKMSRLLCVREASHSHSHTCVVTFELTLKQGSETIAQLRVAFDFQLNNAGRLRIVH